MQIPSGHDQMRHIQYSQQLQRAAGHPLVIALSELLSDHAMDWYGSVAFIQDIYYIECLPCLARYLRLGPLEAGSTTTARYMCWNHTPYI